MNEYLENSMTVEELVQKCPKDFKVQARICTGWSPIVFFHMNKDFQSSLDFRQIFL